MGFPEGGGRLDPQHRVLMKTSQVVGRLPGAVLMERNRGEIGFAGPVPFRGRLWLAVTMGDPHTPSPRPPGGFGDGVRGSRLVTAKPNRPQTGPDFQNRPAHFATTYFAPACWEGWGEISDREL
jgi:hypothetical protein